MNKFKLALILIAVSCHFAAATPTAATVDPLETKLETIAGMQKEGQYAQAQSAYEEVLETFSLSSEHQSTVWSEYLELNRKILFSKTESPTSQLYEVRPGDSLYKIAKQYGTTVGLIKRSNQLTRDVIHPGMQLKVEGGKFFIEVDKSENTLKLYFNDKPIKVYSVATGENNNTPTGTFTIKNKLENPTWYYEGKAIAHDDPENILGTRWLGFDLASYGIHGTTMPESIGKQASAGCVRMLNEEVEELSSIIPVGTKVTIVD